MLGVLGERGHCATRVSARSPTRFCPVPPVSQWVAGCIEGQRRARALRCGSVRRGKGTVVEKADARAMSAREQLPHEAGTPYGRKARGGESRRLPPHHNQSNGQERCGELTQTAPRVPQTDPESVRKWTSPERLQGCSFSERRQVGGDGTVRTSSPRPPRSSHSWPSSSPCSQQAAG